MTEEPEEEPDFGTVTRFVARGQILTEESFEVDISTFAVGSAIPVDIYWAAEGSAPRTLITQGSSYSREAHELIQGSDIGAVKIPQSQRRNYEMYRQSIEARSEEQRQEGYEGRFTNPEEVAKQFHFMERFQTINVYVLAPGSKLLFDLFCKMEQDVQQLQQAGTTIDADKVGRWIEQDANLLIENAQRKSYELYLHSIARNSKDPVVKTAFVRENSRMLVSNLAENPRSEKLLAETKTSVSDLTTSIMENPDTFYGMMKINNHDYYTFTHSVNVSSMTLALGMECGITEAKDLSDLGLGALMHDLGKAQVDEGIINKPGKLTDEEFTTVKGHVNLGYELLKKNTAVPERAFYPLLQHHEKLSGNGYPNKLQADQIHIFGRISAIIDVYDALTTERSYKKAFAPFEALALIAKNDQDFDQEIFATFVQLLSKQKING